MIEKAYHIKDQPAKPEIYFGANILEWSISGEKMRAMSSRCYIYEAIRCLEVELQKAGQRLVRKPSTPMTSGYRPKLDVSPLLEPDQASYL